MLIVISLRAIAMMTSLCGFPRSLRRLATVLRTGVWQAAASAAWNSTCRRDRPPPAIILLPLIAPLSCGTGASPVMAAASPDVIRPSSGNSAISIAAETGPIPGIERRRFAFVASGSVCAMTFSILRSMTENWASSTSWRSSTRLGDHRPWSRRRQKHPASCERRSEL